MHRVVLVTGASSGIGAATVRRLQAEGYVVYATARRTARMQPLADAGARLLPLDVTNEHSMQAAIEAIRSAEGRLDVLVNNAGHGAFGALEDVPPEEGRRQFDVNVFGLARLIQLALPMMRAQHSGSIVNITSMGGKIHEPMASWYHATKFAIEGMSDCLRMELAPFGIDVIVIEPGAIRTEWSGIARQSLLATSGRGAYAGQAAVHAAMLEASYESGMVSPPETVAATIAKALRTERPRTRYASGGGASLVLMLRHWLPDRGFDALVRLAARQMSRQREPRH